MTHRAPTRDEQTGKYNRPVISQSEHLDETDALRAQVVELRAELQTTTVQRDELRHVVTGGLADAFSRGQETRRGRHLHAVGED